MVFYIFLFVISAAVFVALISFVFPKLFLDTGCYTDSEGDRGLQKFKGEDFLAVSYMPQEKFRGVVEQYVLEDKKGEKTVKCKLTGDFKYIDYDIVAYSHDKKIIDVIKVKEIISEKGFTKATKIPYEANYVTIWVFLLFGGKRYRRIVFRETLFRSPFRGSVLREFSLVEKPFGKPYNNRRLSRGDFAFYELRYKPKE